jgi:hypothetical protein
MRGDDMDETIFDYNEAAIRENIPQAVLEQIVRESQLEFPFDDMMRELHIIRAINSYSMKAKRTAS